ncbi:Pentatricopeptide repeat-containing protein [Dendrobium catenatum]|uniref:Pentatricopeptide repeat-containing protein n=1 Tax=Dendrobium catenatum TaxID=906689 RepID=A0A2I0XFH7_9ASPA|nr:Pentatricopeptide repeat-containing protein [Dendrobium catenatum]
MLMKEYEYSMNVLSFQIQTADIIPFFPYVAVNFLSYGGQLDFYAFVKKYHDKLMVRVPLMALLVGGVNTSTQYWLQGILSENVMDYLRFGKQITKYFVGQIIIDVTRRNQDLSNSVCKQYLNEVVGRRLVDRVAYGKSCEFVVAFRVFDEMSYYDITIWNELQDANVDSNQLTLVVASSACSQLGASEMDMYSKCGDLENALSVFRSVINRNVFVWSSKIADLAMHGRGKEVLDPFQEIQEAKVKPNHVTFTNILSACSNAELVEEGRMSYIQMLPLYGIVPDIKHYGCKVDILDRAGSLEEAMDPRCKVFDPGGSIIICTSIFLSMTCLDGVESFLSQGEYDVDIIS